MQIQDMNDDKLISLLISSKSSLKTLEYLINLIINRKNSMNLLFQIFINLSEYKSNFVLEKFAELIYNELLRNSIKRDEIIKYIIFCFKKFNVFFIRINF